MTQGEVGMPFSQRISRGFLAGLAGQHPFPARLCSGCVRSQGQRLRSYFGDVVARLKAVRAASHSSPGTAGAPLPQAFRRALPVPGLPRTPYHGSGGWGWQAAGTKCPHDSGKCPGLGELPRAHSQGQVPLEGAHGRLSPENCMLPWVPEARKAKCDRRNWGDLAKPRALHEEAVEIHQAGHSKCTSREPVHGGHHSVLRPTPKA